MSSDLHLTDSQLESLAETHTGLHALVMAWRDATTGNWVNCHDDISVRCGDDIAEIVTLEDGTLEDLSAIVQTRNKIELAAAEAYWRDGSRWAFNSAELDMALDDRHKYAEQKLAAIRAALREAE